MVTISVKGLIGKSCMNDFDGDVVRAEILKTINDGPVTVDLKGTVCWSYEFMDHALGRLLKTIPYETIKLRLSIDNAGYKALKLASLAINDAVIKNRRV